MDIGEKQGSANKCKFLPTLAVGVVALCLCGCATANEDGTPTYWGEILDGAKSACTVVAGTVMANPEQSASILEWIGGTLSVCGMGGVGAAFIWGGNKLRKVLVKKPQEPVATEVAEVAKPTEPKANV